MGNKVLKICCGTWKNASHDKRELSVYRELDEEVCVLAKGNDNDFGRIEIVDSYTVYRVTTRPYKKLPVLINRVLSLFIWASFVKDISPTVITGHDIDGLTIGWMSNWFKRNKALLIYDSHELELERNVKRNRIQKVIIKMLERHLIKKSAFMTVVNEEICDEVVNAYSLNERPIVTRNMPLYWDIDESVQNEMREKVLPDNIKDKFIIMYHGILMKGRGLDKFLGIIREDSNVAGVIIGDGEKMFVESLMKTVQKMSISDRIFFHPSVPVEELWKYVGMADLGMILAPATCKNHLYSLPNKFFENIQSEIPVICPSYPSMGSIVDKYKIGLSCDPTSIKELVKSVEKMRRDRTLYESCKNNCIFAKKDLCWDKEKKKLERAYKEKVLRGNNHE